MIRGAAEFRTHDSSEVELLARDLLLCRFDAQLGGAPPHRSTAGEVERLRERQELLGLASAFARVVEGGVGPPPLPLDVTAREIELRGAERDDALRALRDAHGIVFGEYVRDRLGARRRSGDEHEAQKEALKTQSPLLSQKRGS
ncbi:MAG TPA: hypothetical protein VGF28_11400 [Thermoanaerobaculia bacterium]